jgi:hypothetical protein
LATSCVEYFDWDTFKNIQDPVITEEEAANEIREIAADDMARDLATKVFGYQDAGFSKAKHGFDHVFRNGDRLVIVEAKSSAKSGPSALGKILEAKEAGMKTELSKHRQMSRAAVENTAGKMANKIGSYRDGKNQSLGTEILDKLKDRKVDYVLINYDPDRNEAKVYQSFDEGRTWKETDRLDSVELYDKLGGH